MNRKKKKYSVFMEFNNLHWETVSKELADILCFLMKEPLFDPFRLVGGTNLSLRFGHRYSVDIDLFSDAEYGSIDFSKIDRYLSDSFRYCDYFDGSVGMGRMYYIGNNYHDCIKLDLMYTDGFIDPVENFGVVRMASSRDIAAMKMDAILNSGRKKDFWDIEYLMDAKYSLDQMCNFHSQRQPYTHDRQHLLEQIIHFDSAEEQPDPVCLLGKEWDQIKLNLLDNALACLDTYNKLKGRYGKETLKRMEILQSYPCYSGKKFIGNFCCFILDGKKETLILN